LRFSTHEARSGFKAKLKRHELTVGTWVNILQDPVLIKLIGYAGFDYVLLDAEHSGATPESLSVMSLLARECGVFPIVRPSDPDDLKTNGRLLDAGATGLLVSHVESASQARRIVNSMRYCNGGTRGYNTRSIFSGFERMTEELMLKADEEVVCVVSFESPEVIERADEILAVDGIDIAIVGRGDLSHNLGVGGKTDDERVLMMTQKVFAAASRQKKTAGLLVNSTEEAEFWIKSGAGFLSLSSEVGLLLSAYQNAIQSARKAFQMKAEATRT
jgi:2-keto-3-deoxy-L-rhamnonate aldolase RhmA